MSIDSNSGGCPRDHPDLAGYRQIAPETGRRHDRIERL
jgi:hypothetical protein